MLLVFINVFLIFFNLIVAFICLGEIFLIVLYFAFPSWSLSRYILRFQVKERWFYFEKMKSTTTFHRFLLFPVSRTGCVLHVFCCIALNSFSHFQVSLMMTIVGLAQNFVGSNNLNFLQPLGQFGTRLHGGKDSASPRYIFTMLRSASFLKGFTPEPV